MSSPSAWRSTPLSDVGRELYEPRSRSWRVSLLASLGLLVALGCRPSADADVAEQLNRAQRLEQADRPLQAAVELGKALALAPEEAEARRQLAELLQSERQWRAAEAEYRRALSLEPNAPTFVALGDLLRNGERFVEAISAYRSALDLNARSPEAVDGLCRAQVESEAFEAAVDDCRFAVKLNPRDISRQRRLGYVLLQLGRHEEAAEVLLERSDISPGAREAILQRLGESEKTP